MGQNPPFPAIHTGDQHRDFGMPGHVAGACPASHPPTKPREPGRKKTPCDSHRQTQRSQQQAPNTVQWDTGEPEFSWNHRVIWVGRNLSSPAQLLLEEHQACLFRTLSHLALKNARNNLLQCSTALMEEGKNPTCTNS